LPLAASASGPSPRTSKGSSVTVPIADGRLCLGTWQGIYLCEHRDHGGPRRLMLTVHGEYVVN